jgi:hypothetical protein
MNSERIEKAVIECSCCSAKARFEVDGVNSCGRHLSYLVLFHAPLKGQTAKVEVLGG